MLFIGVISNGCRKMKGASMKLFLVKTDDNCEWHVCANDFAGVERAIKSPYNKVHSTVIISIEVLFDDIIYERSGNIWDYIPKGTPNFDVHAGNPLQDECHTVCGAYGVSSFSEEKDTEVVMPDNTILS